MLDPVIHKMITYVQNLEEKDLKDKVALCFSLFLVCALVCLSVVSFKDDASLIVPAPGQYPGPAVSHQAAVHEVPKGTGHCGG